MAGLSAERDEFPVQKKVSVFIIRAIVKFWINRIGILLFFHTLALWASENRIRVGFSGFPSSTLHYLAYDEYSEAVTSLVLEPLVRLNLDSLKPEPALANSYESNSQLTRFEFRLNPKARFSDGSPVTVNDIAFTLKTITHPSSKALIHAGLFAPLKCTLKDTQTVIFESSKPIPSGVAFFSQFYVLSEKHFSQKRFDRDFNETFVGSGPYQFRAVIWGKTISLKRNPNFWGQKEKENLNRFHFEEIDFEVQSDPNALLQMLIKDQIDYLYFLSSKSWVQDTQSPLFKTGAIQRLEVMNDIPFAMAGIAWNLRLPLFQDIRIRQALALLFDRNRLMSDFFFNQYQLATGIAHSQSDYHHPRNTPIPFDPGKAQALVKEAGWKLNRDKFFEKNGKLLEFEILTGNPPATKYLSFYQEILRQNGIRTNLKVVDWATYVSLRNQGNFEALDFSRNRDEWMLDLSTTWHSRGAKDPASGNVMGYHNKKADSLLEQLNQPLSLEKKFLVVRELDLLISSDFPMAFSWEPRSQRIAFWNRFTFEGTGYHAYSKWNQLFFDWKRKS